MSRLPTVTTPAEPFVAAQGNGPTTAENGRPNAQRRTRQDGDIFEQLAAPFPAECIGFKPQAINGRKALAIAYLDARAIMDRLDQVLGPNGWQDDYESLPSGEVKCTLTLRIDGEWISKADVGGRSDQQDEGDQVKAAFSDALKRAAVKWGIGRYLYHLPKQWVGYDPDRRCFTEPPKLPDWALPISGNDANQPKSPTIAAPAPQPSSLNANPSAAKTNGRPSDGRSLFNWLKHQERALVEDRLCRPGELVEYTAQAGAKAGHGTQIVRWSAAAVQFGLNAGLTFVARCKAEPDNAA